MFKAKVPNLIWPFDMSTVNEGSHISADLGDLECFACI